LKYIVEYNIPFSSVYGNIERRENGQYYTTGRDRTGCIWCCFGINSEKEPNRFQMLKQTHPKLYEYCMRDWNKGGLGLKKVLDAINIKSE
jgi:hypothetical protein